LFPKELSAIDINSKPPSLGFPLKISLNIYAKTRRKQGYEKNRSDTLASALANRLMYLVIDQDIVV
jgi:hypothetical protein